MSVEEKNVDYETVCAHNPHFIMETSTPKPSNVATRPSFFINTFQFGYVGVFPHGVDVGYVC